MRKPDRFDRAVDQAYQHYLTHDELIRPLMAGIMRAEHKAVVRLVRRIGETVDAGASATSAINTVLAALSRRAK